MGEAKRRQAEVLKRADSMIVATPGGRLHVQWDGKASATPIGQLAFFAEFLHTSGAWSAWVQDCPLTYTSPNAPTKHDVLGTWLLSILAGHKRYAHVSALRGDTVSAQVLGMNKIISEDALRRALTHISAADSTPWLQTHLGKSVNAALSTAWILDIDTTIKSLYGKQEGAQVSYNPHKPGRPSHALHTYWVGNLRLVLDVEVAAGLDHSARHALPGLTGVLDRLQASQRPALVRGDCGFGNDPVLEQMEEREQPYLFKLRQSKGVHRLLHRQFSRDDWTVPTPADQGWQAVESALKLAGWKRERRVVVLRRPLKQDVALAREKKSRGGKQLDLALPGEGFVAYEYAVLVTNADYGLSAIAQLYRDRADAENGFDELKNQWGWGGFTTQDLARCQSAARTVALVYNWWSWYCRAAQPGARMEAQTSRPLLLAAVGRAIRHAGQSVLYLTPLHGAAHRAMAMIANIRAVIAHINEAAEQLTSLDRWDAMINYIVTKIVTALPKNRAKLPCLAVGNCRI